MEGWVKFHRKSYENFLYRENRPHTRREAWEDIIALVNHEDSFCLIGNEKIICSRGQSIRSLEGWGKLFRWDKSKVRRFLDLLNKEEMVLIENLHKTTRITVCNYETYQSEQNASETHLKRKRHANDTRPTPNKNDKNDKNKETFDAFRNKYLGTKRGLDTEFENFQKHGDWLNILPILEIKLSGQIQARERQKQKGEFVPHWKNLKTWINQRCWEEEIGTELSLFPINQTKKTILK
jgi:tmRNA-binding protein